MEKSEAERSGPRERTQERDETGNAADNTGEAEVNTEAGDSIEAVPKRERADALTVVGVGASAGGVQALQEFFSDVPRNSNLIFVVVLHLSPAHESHLAEILGNTSAIPVEQVSGPVRVEPNRIYVIPPSKHLVMDDGMLRLREMEQPQGRRVAIDRFFRTLADARGPQAVGVVLSGTGADGALGVKLLKEVGGLAIAQEPGGAEYDAMPRHAIATGFVDYVLPAREIVGQIIAYRDASARMRLPAEAAPSIRQREDGAVAEAALVQILGLVRELTGHDFAHYKRATVLRRIGRRLQVHNLEDLPAYLAFLHRHPAEANDLLGDLLISVTQFFRDREVWEYLERDVIPRLFEGKGLHDEIRVWVCACATGEEAYSLAILLLEQAARMERPPRIQIFATDMDADSIAHAREASYPDTIAADVSPERLRGWFYQDNGRYRIRKEVRECVLFALHNVLKDTPFSRLDLVTCRNLLIYLNRPAQERVFDIFHFAIRPESYLLLGTSEAVEGASPLFATIDKTHRIYIRRSLARPVPLVPSIPGRLTPIPAHVSQIAGPGEPAREQRAVSAGELHRDLLEMYAPPSVLIDEDHQIIHLSNAAGRFLRFIGGEPTSNLLRVVHPDLRLEVSTALYAAVAEGRDQARTVQFVSEPAGPARRLNITVRPVREPAGARGYFLVLFEEASGVPEQPPEPAAPVSGAAAAAYPDVTRQLEQEIDRLQGQLRSAIEQYEASIEELRASNEELQAMNEEMRSATEELETSKEELQSVNEELSTVNQELKNRIVEVSSVNADLQNLLVSTDIGTVFLDRELRIKRYTPAAETLFNVIPSDLGRPLAHTTHRLDYHDLIPDAEGVLRRLTPVEREVRSYDDHYYLARVRPYRTLEERIDGVVLTFVDITERKQAEEALRASEERLRLLIESAKDYAIFALDADRKVTRWNTGARTLFGYAEREIVGQSGDIIFTPEDRGAAEREAQVALAEGRVESERWHVRKDGSRFFGSGSSSVLRDINGEFVGFVKIMRDLTERKQTEEAIRESEERFRLLVYGAADYAMFMLDTENHITFWSTGAEHVFGWTEPQALGQPGDIIFTPEDREAGAPDRERQQALADGSAPDRRWHMRKDGTRLWVDGALMRLDDEHGALRGFAKIARDATDELLAQEALRRAHDEMEMRVAERTASLSEALTALEAALAERRQAEAARQETLALLAGSEEEERRRLSRELHDQTGQHLTGLMLGLDALRASQAPGSDAAVLAERLRQVAADLSHEVHQLAWNLRPPALDELGLEATLITYIQEWQEHHGIEADFHAHNMEGERLAPEVETTLYRIVQEALTNIARHAQAGRVSVVLERRRDAVLVVEDDGIGFDVEKTMTSSERLGLRGMRERASVAGGTLAIETVPNQGTTLIVRIPLAQNRQDPHE